MRLASIKIENFRSIKNIEIELPQVCAIVGRNNAGKSNILEAVRRVLAGDWGPRTSSFSEDDVYLRDPKLDITIECSFEPLSNTVSSKKAIPFISGRCNSYTHTINGVRWPERRLEQTCFDEAGKQPTVMTGYPRRSSPPKFEPLLGVPAEIREAVPLIHIGADRSLRRQLPNQQYSLLRRIFEDIDEDFQNPENKVAVRDRDGNEHEVPRTERLQRLLTLVMKLLKTDKFKRVETSIKPDLAISFQIPVGVVYDKDSSDFTIWSESGKSIVSMRMRCAVLLEKINSKSCHNATRITPTQHVSGL